MSQQEPWKVKVDLLRKRFSAREDVFCVKDYYPQTENTPEGPKTVMVAKFHPQYAQQGDEGTKQPLTDEWLWKHISGEKELVPYMVRRDGIKYGACDFDYGNPFEDAKKVKDFSLSLGLACYIARSSQKGYHLYWFFDKPAPPYLFTSLIHFIYEKVGFHARYLENPALTIPETFPKQTSFEENKFGNGILIPMIEPKMRKGLNCWVDDQAVPLKFESQWDYLAACKEITLERLQEVLEANQVDITYAPTSRSRGSLDRVQKEKQTGVVQNDEVKPRGDFLRVIDSCPAMKQFWQKNDQGAYVVPPGCNEKFPPHDARIASLAFARATTNGPQIIRDRWPSSRTDWELNYSNESNQHPWTCRAMQDKGLCRRGVHPIHGDHCLKKTPPVVWAGNQMRVNPDQVPETEWKEPSPIRFATGYLTYEQITKGVSELFEFKKKKITIQAEGVAHEVDAPPPENLSEQLYDYTKKIRRLSPDEQKRAKEFISANKFIPTKEYSALEKRAHKEEEEERYKEKKSNSPNFSFHGCDYLLKDMQYWRTSWDKKGIPTTTEISNFHIEIKEEIVLLSSVDESDSKNEQTAEQRWFKGVIHVGEKKYHFKCPSNEWIRSGDTFFSVLTNHAGGDLKYFRADYDDIRNCINHFSESSKIIRKRVKDFGHVKQRGEFMYISPSVIITKDEIKPNKELDLQISGDAGKALDFKIIDDKQFKEVAAHIIADYFECNLPTATMMMFAHALAASIISHLPLKKSPVLWIDGSFSGGKSFIAEMAQNFYGNFDNLTGTNSTGKAKIQMAHNFRDALLVIDDFKKSLSDYGAKEMIQFVHSAYDRSSREALQRNGQLRDPARIRGLIAVTGEEYPNTEASAISRMLIVDVGSKNKNLTRGEQVKLRKSDYCGFTPYFIQFVYEKGEEAVSRIYYEYLQTFSQLFQEGEKSDSNHRIAENLAHNMTAFRLAMELLYAKGVIPVQKKEELCTRHVKNLDICRASITAAVTSQRGATAFLDAVKELLQDPARYHLINWGRFDPNEHRSSKALGFYRSRDPDVVFLYTSTVLGEVDSFLRKSQSYAQSKHHVARQLFEDGHIPPALCDAKNATYAKQVQTPQGNRQYCWAIKIESLGFTQSDPKKEPSSPVNTHPQNNVVNIAVGE